MIFDKYPYTNFHEMNDDWIIQTLREFEQRLNDFVAANSLTYADPIEYNPETPYPAFTIVIYNATAYMSKRAVPAGVIPSDLTTEYWLLIFPFGDLINSAINDAVDQGVEELTTHVDEYMQQAIDSLPAIVSAWLAEHPEITTTIPDMSISFRKLTHTMTDVLFAGCEASELSASLNNSVFVQGALSTYGSEIAASNACRTDFVQFGKKGTVVIKSEVDYISKVYRYTTAGVFVDIPLSDIIDTQWNAFAVDLEHLYRFVIMRADSANFTPADLTLVPIRYYMETSIFALQSDVNMLVPVNLADVTFTTGKYVKFDNGNLVNSEAAAASDYIDVAGVATIYYSRIFKTLSSSFWGIAFYDSERAYISGIRVGLNASETHYENAVVDVPATAHYVRITKESALSQAPYVYDKADYDNKMLARMTTAENRINDLDTEIGATEEVLNDVTAQGWSRIRVPFELGGWLTFNSKDSRTYRVRTVNKLSFPYPVYIIADEGYMVGGYTASGSLGGTIVALPANTDYAMYVRRFTENTSETADVETFASKVHVSTALSDMNRLAYTYTDVSMFERVGISGDSYAAGGGIISGVTALTWGKNLQRQAGILVDIYAKSGDSIVDWVVNQTKGLPALLAGPECGLYWFQHGINGTSSAAALGTPADMSADPKPQTFYGQYVYAIEAVKAAFPNARIVLATVTGTSYGLSQSTYVNANTAIRNIAAYCNVPCIEITEDEFFKSLWYSDGMRSNHPTAMIAAGMSMAYRRLLAKCIMQNPAYFLTYGS